MNTTWHQEGTMLIALEGIDGSGKSTLARNLSDALRQEGHNVLLTKEPGGSKLGTQLRELLQTQPIPITPVAEFLLFAADRAQHFEDVILPALRTNSIIISDRMGDSSIAYQGYGRGISIANIAQVNEWSMQTVKPDLTFYIRITPEQAAQRLQGRSTLTAFEQEKTEFMYKLIDGFDTLYHNRTDVCILDGTQPPHELTSLATKAVRSWLSNRHK